MTRVACIGECMVELTMPPRGQTGGSIGYAGDTFNTAVYLRREGGPDVSVSYVTGLGRDDLSERMIEFFASHDIATDLVQRRDDRNPGLYAISVDAAGERTFTYWRESSAARTLFAAPADVRPESLAGFDLIYLSGITLAVLSAQARADLLAFLPGFRAEGGRVAFDSNYRPRLWPDVATARRVMRAYWAQTDIALPSVDDEMALWNDADEDAVLARFTASGVARRRAQARVRRAASHRVGRSSAGFPRRRAGRRHHRRRRQLQRRLSRGGPARRRAARLPRGRARDGAACRGTSRRDRSRARVT